MPGVVAPPGGLGGAAGDATPGGFGDATGRLQRQRHAQPVEQLPARRRQQQRHLQHRLRAAAAAGRDPGVQDPDALLRRRVRPQRRLGRQRRHHAGSNTLHGAAWEFNRDDALQARNFFAPPTQPKPKLKQNQFGGSARRPARAEQAVRVRLLRGLPQHQRHHQNVVVLSRRAAQRRFLGSDARSAIR